MNLYKYILKLIFLKQNVSLKNFSKELNDQRKVLKCFRRI